jgi:hypothetical protein
MKDVYIHTYISVYEWRPYVDQKAVGRVWSRSLTFTVTVTHLVSHHILNAVTRVRIPTGSLFLTGRLSKHFCCFHHTKISMIVSIEISMFVLQSRITEKTVFRKKITFQALPHSKDDATVGKQCYKIEL